MKAIHSLSIKWKLAFIMVAVASVVSIAQIVLFSIYDARTFFELKRTRMRILADVVGRNAIPALRFADRQDALEVLSSLEAQSSIRSAYLFDDSHRVVAEYLRHGETLSVPIVSSIAEQEVFEGDNYILLHPIIEERRTLGSLYMSSDLEELRQRRRQELIIGGTAGAACFVLSLLLALHLQRIFTTPIASMAETMERITREKNYALRAPKLPPDEFGQLSEGLNYMLTEIEARDNQLAEQMQLLRRTNKELDQFIYVASHDLKAPLRGVDNLAHMISRAVKDVLPADKQEYLTLMHSRIRRMEKLFDDLLEYSRVGRIQPTAEAVDIVALAREVFELLAPPKGFTLELPDEPLSIITARTPLEQILRNLISNALKHHDRPNGKITVNAASKGGWIEVSVCDDGPGIPPQYHEKIFEMFQTLRPRDAVEGSGMGLALVKKIVENQGGKVWVRSVEGQGSCFHFTWAKGSRA